MAIVIERTIGITIKILPTRKKIIKNDNPVGNRIHE